MSQATDTIFINPLAGKPITLEVHLKNIEKKENQEEIKSDAIEKVKQKILDKEGKNSNVKVLKQPTSCDMFGFCKFFRNSN